METKIKPLYQSIIKDIKEKKPTSELQKQIVQFTELVIEEVESKKVSPKVAVKYFESLYTPRFYSQLDNFSQTLVNEGLLLKNKNYLVYLKLLKETLESIKEAIAKQKRVKETQMIVLQVKKKLRHKLKRLPTPEEIMDYLRKHHPDRVSYEPFDIMDFANVKKRVVH